MLRFSEKRTRQNVLLLTAVAIAAELAGETPPASAAQGWLIPPVDAPIEAPFVAPTSEFGPGHRGVDYDVPAGSAVRAAGAGSVRFAGSVAGNLAVTVDHGGGLVSTYSILSEIDVSRGQHVDPGTWLGRTARSHPGDGDGFHFGVKLHGAYVDPSNFLGPLDLGDALHLAPLLEQPSAAAHRPPECSRQQALDGDPSAPNDNVAVVVAGIDSATGGRSKPDIFGAAPDLLGYPERRTYRFSYRGMDGRRLHAPYGERDTYGDLRLSGLRLRDLLEEIASRHPGRDVDILAHSQGGILARSFLQESARNWDVALPRVEHLVTFSTPHSGSPLAGAVEDIADNTFTGGALLRLAAKLPSVPDADATSLAQLVPGSPLLERLAREDVLFGTRTLALGIPNDVIVPADRALLPEETARVLPPEGVNAHDHIVRSRLARGIAHAFLSDASNPCRGLWDALGPALGRVAGFIEARAGWAYSELESKVGGSALGALRRGLPAASRAASSAGRATARAIRTGRRFLVGRREESS
jgi:Peptidase family M23/PGAP1-like protein